MTKIVYEPKPEMARYVLRVRGKDYYIGTKADSARYLPEYTTDIAAAGFSIAERGHVDTKDVFEFFVEKVGMSWLHRHEPSELEMVEFSVAGEDLEAITMNPMAALHTKVMPQAPSSKELTANLTSLVARLARRLLLAEPGNSLSGQAMTFLQKNKLIGSPLRLDEEMKAISPSGNEMGFDPKERRAAYDRMTIEELQLRFYAKKQAESITSAELYFDTGYIERRSFFELKGINPPAEGMDRQWLKCRVCGEVMYYDFVPFSMGNPLRISNCGHGDGRKDLNCDHVKEGDAYDSMLRKAESRMKAKEKKP